MIEQGLFKRHFVGRDGFQWWIGQVAPEESWVNNIPGVPVESNEDSAYAGFGERVRVRIMGHNTAVKTDIPDDELPWAHVMYPVTAGGGGRGSWTSMNLVGGNFVFGFFLDGEDAQQPIIIGCIGYNDYQAVMKNIPDTSFVPFSGYQQETPNNEVPPYSVKQAGQGIVAQQESGTGQPNNELIVESVQGSNSTKEMSAFEMQRKGSVGEPIVKSEDCEPLPTERIKKETQNIMAEINYIQKSIYNVHTAISLGSADIQGQIATLQGKHARFTSANTKSILIQTEKKVLKEMNDKAKQSYSELMANERPKLKEEMRIANEEIACKYTKVIDKAFGMSNDFLGDLIGSATDAISKEVGNLLNTSGAMRAINIPLGFVDDFAGTALGAISGEIDNQLDGILGKVNDIIEGFSLDSILAGGFGGLDIIGDLGSLLGGSKGSSKVVVDDSYSFFKCEEENQCPVQDTWSSWYGMDIGTSQQLKSEKQINSTGKSTKKNGDAYNQMDTNDVYAQYTAKYGTGAIGEVVVDPNTDT